jgi:hypothetical protein
VSTTQLALNNGIAMPALGFGVFQTPPAETRSAAAYGNERRPGARRHHPRHIRPAGPRSLIRPDG